MSTDEYFDPEWDGRTPVIDHGCHLAQGARRYQHDRVITHRTYLSSSNPMVVGAVFDGHGGDDMGHLVSASCEAQLLAQLHAKSVWQYLEAMSPKALRPALEDVMKELEEDAIGLNMTNRAYFGSTLCAILLSTEIIVSVNIGDSRAVLAERDEDGALSATDLTIDHIPSNSNEHRRVIQNGGWIERNSVNGYITMTRALGDADLKAHRNFTKFPRKPHDRELGPRLFISDPDIAFFKRNRSQRFVIVASDGVWETLSSDTAVKIVDSSLRNGAKAEKAAAVLVHRAVSAGSADNCSAAIIVFERDPKGYKSRWKFLNGMSAKMGIARK